MTKIIAVITAHTDEEAVDCGDTHAKKVATGDYVLASFWQTA